MAWDCLVVLKRRCCSCRSNPGAKPATNGRPDTSSHKAGNKQVVDHKAPKSWSIDVNYGYIYLVFISLYMYTGFMFDCFLPDLAFIFTHVLLELCQRLFAPLSGHWGGIFWWPLGFLMSQSLVLLTAPWLTGGCFAGPCSPAIATGLWTATAASSSMGRRLDLSARDSLSVTTVENSAKRDSTVLRTQLSNIIDEVHYTCHTTFRDRSRCITVTRF